MAYDPNNVGKYYYCRNRFAESFISIGNKPGQCIPFSSRYWNGTHHELRSGETTFTLGTYIAFLATEYRLFKNSNLSTEQTVKELFYALDALNRLDYNAETFTQIPNSNPPKNFPPKLSGYLVRHDIDYSTFLEENPKITSGFPDVNASAITGYIKNSGLTTTINKIRAASYKPVSRDHIFRIIWGLLLATKLLDDDLHFAQEKFMDGESDFKTECRAIHRRVKNFLSKNGGKIQTPDGTVPIGGNMVIDMAAIKKSSENITGNPRGYKLLSPWAGFMWTGWMNGRMSMEKQCISGNYYKAWNRSWKYGYESFFLYYGKLVYNWPMGSSAGKRQKRDAKLKATTEFYLNVFPCQGNFNHTDSDFTPFGWAMPDRSERSIADAYFGMHAKGNFNSLDFLLMHNFYYLNHFTELGPFPENTNQDYAIDPNYIDKEVMKTELARVQKHIDHQSVNDYMRFYKHTIRAGLKKYNSGPSNFISSFLRKSRWALISFGSSYNQLKKERKEFKEKLEEMGRL
ncbi:hypothetical protein [Owenweeksia hongkongensis]|uniref:Uncharacterized protein n=1 Tax=Owenweeksia hongkongensis (strain DSM 17368 / CIP 108786 / JCM 12287 / NRRL B-23963 / UST20020801) TaxID=926562 RepID=G8R4R7_OWEHD|nr:hypothetical protein [Owenweeksia hongkongensis]AEV33191.1 hypothetical protein Oweho_2217 [Owenweeksia hongkongensis DSM 17368]